MKRYITILVLLLSLLTGFAVWRAVRTQAAPVATTIRVPEDQPTIQAAINAASAGDTVDVKAGTYDTKVVLDKAITVKCRTGTGDDCIVQGTGGVEANILFEFNGAGVVTVLDGFTVRRGTGVGTIFGSFEFNDLAGGMYIRNGARPVIRNCKILENRAVLVTAGITVADAFPEFSNCLIGDNLGVGMRVVGTSIATINGCTFRGNNSVGLALGVGSIQTTIILRGRSTAFINNSRFENNGDAGLELLTRYPSDSQPSAIVTDSVIAGNGADTNSAGSGVNATSAETLSLTNCAVLFNTGRRGGGGISTNSTHELVLTNTLVVGNKVRTPSDGAASAVQALLNDKVTVTNCTISGHAVSTQPTMVLWVTSPSTVTNTILWGNTSTKDINGVVSFYLTVSNCDTQNGMEGIVDGGGNLSVNPLFVRNALTNGATDAGDLRLQNTSPVKDRGTLTGVNLSTFVKDGNGNPLDYALAPRLSCEGQIDMGAYENQTVTGTLFTPGTPTANGTVGASYTSSVAATPAAPAGFSYRYSLANGTQLPGGLTLNTGTGAITGTPNASGIFNFDVKVELLNPSNNPTACSNTQRRTITICPNLSVTPGPYPSVLRGITSASLPYTATGNPNRYSIDYDTTANAAGFVDVTNAALPASPITLTVPAAALGTYIATLIVRDSVTGCASDAVAFTVTVLSCPTGFTVNTTADTQDAAPGNGACADANGKCSLRAAISEANALKAQSTCTGNITISLFAGTYTQTLPAALEDANAGGDWDISANVTIVGAGAGATIVQAAVAPNSASERVLQVVSGTVTMRNLTVRHGRDVNGGGGIFNSGNLTLLRIAVSQNNGGALGGGGMFNDNSSPTLANVTFSDNSASFDGGGMYNNNSSPTLSNVTFSGNSAKRGGGVFNNNSNPTLTNITFNSNSAINGGGATYNIGNSDPSLRNCILWGDSSSEIINDGASATIYYSIVQGAGGSGLGWNIGFGIDGGGNLDADPKLAPLSDYGGLTQTYALLPGSSAIDAGNDCVLDNSCAPNPLGFNLTADQRGFNRKTGAHVDIGAYESRGFTLAIVKGSPQTTPIFMAFPAPLVVSVSSLFSEPVQGGEVAFSAPVPPGASATLATSPATIDANGQASVNATANGTLGSYQVIANTRGAAAAVNFALTNGCQAITVLPSATTLAGTLGAPFSQTFTQSGGVGTTNFSTASALPTGLTLFTGGVLSGTPTQAGTFQITVNATDSNGCMGTQTYTLTINNSGISPNNLQFYPLAHPVRLLDTRVGFAGCDAPGAMIAGNTSRTQTAAGRTCDGLTIPANAAALVGNVTTVQSGGGYLTLYPSDIAKPLSANSNYSANQVLNNVFTVRLGANDGAFKIFVTTDTDLVVDITGYYAAPSASGLYFHPLPHPVRLLETRAGYAGCFTPGAPLQANSTTSQIATTTCDGVMIPAGAQALVGNATTVNLQSSGWLTLYPANAAKPLAASSNFVTGDIMNAPFTVGLSPSGQFNIFTTSQTDFVIDVTGYYSTQLNDSNGQGLLFNALSAPVRLLDTRANQSGCFTPGAQMIAGTTFTQPATGACTGIPANAKSVVGNATTLNAAAPNGFLTFWPSDANQPTVATSNYQNNQVFNRHFTVGLGADGAFKRFAFKTTDLVIDLVGYFAP